jgi:hypothetical protein
MTRKTERLDDKPFNLKGLAEYLDLSPATVSLVMNKELISQIRTGG